MSERTGWVRLRQVALVAHDLDAVVEQLGAELGLRVAHRDPSVAAFGLQNAVLPLGAQFVEVVSPTQPGTAGGRQLERLGGDGGYMVIGQVGPTAADHEALRARVDEQGVRVVLEDVDGYGNGYRLLQLHPADTGGSFLELDHQPAGEDGDDPWVPAGADWQRAAGDGRVTSITGVEVADPDPDGVARRWAAITGCPLEGRVLTLADATVTVTEGTGGLVAVDCAGAADAEHRIAGVAFRVRRA